MPSRPFTRRQALQNQRFLDALARTGNVRLAARARRQPPPATAHKAPEEQADTEPAAAS